MNDKSTLHLPSVLHIPDTQSERDERHLAIQRVGVKSVRYPITVQVGGTISNRKGVNVPDVVLPLAALSAKDREDLEFACELGVDWLALSFVQRPEDVIEARSLAKGRAAILSKIEKPAAVKAYDAILQVSDGIMVARVDLGVHLILPKTNKGVYFSLLQKRYDIL